MAIYHQHINYIKRSTGRSAVQSVAYIMGLKAYENRREKTINYENRAHDILVAKTLGPEHAAEFTKDPLKLWNSLENFEDHYAETHYKTPETQEWYKNIARVAQTNVVALPKELSPQAMEALVDQFVQDVYVSKGLMVSYAIHQDEGNPHAHIQISLRQMQENGQWSWNKCRELYAKEFLLSIRKTWADYANHYLALEGHSVRIDHRSFVDQGIDLTPSRKRGYMGDKQGKQGRIVFENEQIWLANRDKLMEDLTPLLRELNNTHATFTQKDIVTAIQKRFGDETVIVSQVFEKVLQSVHYAGTDMNGYARYTSHDYKQWEDEVIRASHALGKAQFDYGVKDAKIEQAFDRQPKERELSEEQQTAVRKLTGDQSFAVLNGLAGTGKTTTLRIVADLYQEAGCRVIGASVSALASDKLGKEAGIHSRTLESWLIRWKKYEEARQEYLKFKDIIPSSALGKYEWYRDLKSYEKDRLREKDVLILDEASMVGVKDAHKLLYYVYQSGAKVIFVGDEAQLQSISAGNFFKLAQETAAKFDSFVEMKQIRRQKEEWMQKASVLFAEGSVQEALKEYEKHGCIQGLKAEEAILKIAQEYGAAYAQAVRQEKWQSEVSELLVLTSTNKDCDALNAAIRQLLREKGLISQDDAFVLRQSRKEDDPKVLAPLADEKDQQGQQDKNNPNKVQRGYAIGDQILFLQNDSSHPDYRKVEIFDGSGKFQEKEFIKNNSEGIIQKVTAREGGGFEVQVALLGEKGSPERYAIFNTNNYSAFNYGYSKTAYRSQGQTKDRVWAYATPNMDSFATYVAMTRHRLQATLYYAVEQFPTFQKLLNTLSRGEIKDNIRDWTILDQNQDSYDRVMHYKSLCGDTAVLYKDKEFDGYKDEAYKALAADRKMIAKEILGQWENHKKYVLQAGFSQEMLEITAGYKERQLSRAEEKASQRLEEYAKAASQARELLKEIRDYTEADLKIRGLWETLHPGQIGLEQTKHADYKRFEALRDERDRLAVEIVQDKILHSQFISSITGLSYGLGVMEKQAKAYQERLEQAPRIEKIKGLIQEWKGLTREDHLEKLVNRLEQGFGVEALQRGKIASELVSYYQEDTNRRKDQQQQSVNLGKPSVAVHWTHGELGRAEVSYLDLLREGIAYKAYELAHDRGEGAALRLAEYCQAERVSLQLYKHCQKELEELKNFKNLKKDPISSEQNQKVFLSQTASYDLYRKAATLTNDRAFAVEVELRRQSIEEKVSLQELATSMQVSFDRLGQYARQGEWQSACKRFKEKDDIILKGKAASDLLHWATEKGEGDRKSSKELLHLLNKEQIKLTELVSSVQQYDARRQDRRLDVSHEPLAEAVFGYLDQRQIVNQAYAVVAQKMEDTQKQAVEQGLPAPTVQAWQFKEEWGTYIDARKILDGQAAKILQNDVSLQEPFLAVDSFNLKGSVLKSQAQRHLFEESYLQTKDTSLSLGARLQAFGILEAALSSRFDQQLERIERYALSGESQEFLAVCRSYDYLAVSCLRHHQESITAFKQRQKAFETYFAKEDLKGYQLALAEKSSQLSYQKHQQAQLLEEIQQTLGLDSLTTAKGLSAEGKVALSENAKEAELAKAFERLQYRVQHDYSQTLKEGGVKAPLEPFSLEQVWQQNAQQLLNDIPRLLSSLTENQATFTQQNVLREISKSIEDEEIKTKTLQQILVSPDCLMVGEDMNSQMRYTSSAYQETENAVIEKLNDLKDRSYHGAISEEKIEKAIALVSQADGRKLSDEQQTAVRKLVGDQSIAVLDGLAGTGKTTTLKIVADLYKAEGYTVIGTSFSALAAENLGVKAGIDSSTLASLLIAWEKYEQAQNSMMAFEASVPESQKETLAWMQDLKRYEKFALTDHHALMVDEASMVGMVDAKKLLYFIEQSGAKLILAGDEKQYQAISAGPSYRLMKETAQQSGSYVELREIRRQHQKWMREASLDLAEGRVLEALKVYADHNCVHGLNQDQVFPAMAQSYVQKMKDGYRLQDVRALASYNKDCEAMNTAIRQELRASDLLLIEKQDAFTLYEQGIQGVESKGFALGEKILFKANDDKKVMICDEQGLQIVNASIHNGDQGIIQKVDVLAEGGYAVEVQLLTGEGGPYRTAHFNTNEYNKIDYGYAVTNVKAQGQTDQIDLSYVSKGMGNPYVPWTRHQQSLEIYYASEEFPTLQKLGQSLSQSVHKDLVRDYAIPSDEIIFYDRVKEYKRLKAEERAVYQEVNLNKAEKILALKQQRKDLAELMVEDYRYNGEAIKAVEMGGLTFESLLIEAGHQERPLTAKEKIAQETVQQYAALSFQARSLWEEIKHRVEHQRQERNLAVKEEAVVNPVSFTASSQGLEADLINSAEKLAEITPLKEPSLAFEYTQHEKYSDYLALKDQRDNLAVRIMADEALHRDFVYNRPQAANDQALEQNEGIRYGLWGIKKQAEEFLAREERLKVVQPLLQQWQQLVAGETLDEKVKRLNPEFEAEFKNRGQIASQILSIILEEKTSHETKVTYQEIQKLGLSYFEILQSARDFEAYQVALHKGDDTALRLISYQQARHVTNQLFGQCSREVEKLKEIFAENKQQNPDAFENKPEPVFWHTASYQLYVQAAAITNDRAFELTQGKPFASLPELQALTAEMKLSDKLLKGIDLYSRQGEYQFQCREFKGATDSIVKGEKASLLIDELIENKGLFRVLERQQVKMSQLLESLHEHDVRQKKDCLDLSNHPLAEAVFGYTDQRKVVGQAFAKISQEIESRIQQGLEKGVKIPTLHPWNIEDQWGVYLDHRKVLDSQAAAILSSSAEERQDFMERFNLRLSVLKPQSQRHHFAQAYQQTKDLSLSDKDRAQAFYVLEEAHRNRFDDTLRQLAPYAVNKQDKAQEKADRDYLKSVQTYSHYAFAPLRQNKETVEDFKNRQAAFEQEFKLTDLHGYQDAFKKKEERNQALQQQQAQILTELKQHFGIKGEIKMVSPHESTQQITSQTLEQSWQQLKSLSDKLQQRAKGVEAVEQPARIALDKQAYELVRRQLNSRVEDLAYQLIEPDHGRPRRRGSALLYGNNSAMKVFISGPKQGAYIDFSTGEKGDAFKMIQNRCGLDHQDALKWALSWLGENKERYMVKTVGKGEALNNKVQEKDEWTPIFPAPKEFPNLQSYSLRYMMKDKTEKAHFAYKDAEGNILGYVVRLEDSNGKKSTPPLTYCRNDKGQTQWKWKGFIGEDRPLYGLDQLALKKEAVVLVVEGEKAAEAAKTLFPDHAVISWMGGSYGVPKADWSVLKNRDVVIWPDHDEPGRKAAHKIQEVLITHQNLNVAIVDVPSVFPAKWDLADALPEGIQYQDLQNHIATAKLTRAQEMAELEVTPKVDMNLLVASQNQAKEPIEVSLSSLEQGRGINKGWSDDQENKAMDLGVRDQSFVLPPEKEALAYYQFLEEENKGLLSHTRTPEQQQRVESVNKEMEETAYAISHNPTLMEEAQKNNLTHHIMIDKEAYLQSLTKSQQELTDMNEKPSKEKDILNYYQYLEKEVSQLNVMFNKTPEQEDLCAKMNKEIEETAYQISNNPGFMKEAQKKGIKDSIMVDREAYLQSQEEKKALVVNDLAVEAPVVQQQTLKAEEASLAQTVAATETSPSPALSAVSERELVKQYLEIDEQMKAIPTAASRSEEEKVRYEALFNSSLALSHQISQSPKAMKAITVLGLEENVTLKAERYQRLHQANSQQVQLDEAKVEKAERIASSTPLILEDQQPTLLQAEAKDITEETISVEPLTPTPELKQKDILSYYQVLEQENSKLIVLHAKTPEQEEKSLSMNQEVEELAYQISTNPVLMKEAVKRNLDENILFERDTYLAAWQNHAQEKVEKGELKAALDLYDHQGHLHLKDKAQDNMIQHYQESRISRQPGDSILLVSTVEEKEQLSQKIRQYAQETGALGKEEVEITFRTRLDPLFKQNDWVKKSLAVGDQVCFYDRAERIGLKTNEVAVITKVDTEDRNKIYCQRNDLTEKSFYPFEYAYVDHAYVMTLNQAEPSPYLASSVPKRQFKESFIHVNQEMDFKKTVQALSRHQESCHLYADKAIFKDQEHLFQQLERKTPETSPKKERIELSQQQVKIEKPNLKQSSPNINRTPSSSEKVKVEPALNQPSLKSAVGEQEKGNWIVRALDKTTNWIESRQAEKEQQIREKAEAEEATRMARLLERRLAIEEANRERIRKEDEKFANPEYWKRIDEKILHEKLLERFKHLNEEMWVVGEDGGRRFRDFGSEAERIRLNEIKEISLKICPDAELMAELKKENFKLYDSLDRYHQMAREEVESKKKGQKLEMDMQMGGMGIKF